MNQKTKKQLYGCTYVTEPGDSFGEVISIFPVDEDWDGYKFHGYGFPSEQELADYLKD